MPYIHSTGSWFICHYWCNPSTLPLQNTHIPPVLSPWLVSQLVSATNAPLMHLPGGQSHHQHPPPPPTSTSPLFFSLPASCMTLKSLPAAPLVNRYSPLSHSAAAAAALSSSKRMREKREAEREEDLSLSFFGFFPVASLRHNETSTSKSFVFITASNKGAGIRLWLFYFHSVTTAGSLHLLTGHKSPWSPEELYTGAKGKKPQHWVITLTRKKVIIAHWSGRLPLLFIASGGTFTCTRLAQ